MATMSSDISLTMLRLTACVVQFTGHYRAIGTYPVINSHHQSQATKLYDKTLCIYSDIAVISGIISVPRYNAENYNEVQTERRKKADRQKRHVKKQKEYG